MFVALNRTTAMTSIEGDRDVPYHAGVDYVVSHVYLEGPTPAEGVLLCARVNIVLSVP